MIDKNDSDDEDIILAAALTAVAASIICFEEVEDEHTGDNSSLTSSGSTGRSRRSAKRSKSKKIVDQIDNLSSQIRGKSAKRTQELADQSGNLNSQTVGQSSKRRHKLVDQINNLSSQIDEVIEATGKTDHDISSTLHSEIMKSESYDEVALGKAFGYLLEHENQARAFLAKNHILRQSWLSNFFSGSGQHGGQEG